MEIVPIENFNVSNYRISTISVTGSIGCSVNLSSMYNAIDIDKHPAIQYIEYGSNKYNHNYKGSKLKKSIKVKEKTKRFDNQLTLVYTFKERIYNIKLFKNGNVQMTGVKSTENGERMVDELINFIGFINKDFNTKYPDISKDEKIIQPDVEDQLKNSDYSVRLINSDFKVNYEIKRDILYKLLLQVYGINCTYEPCIYPGVKIAFYVNKDRINEVDDGICKCDITCIGKKTVCKRITIAIFQSGCVIITGANEMKQIETTYHYISNILEKHRNQIIRRRLIPTNKLNSA